MPPRPAPVKTHIIIVNYRTPELTVEAVASVVPQRALLQGGKVFIVDNHSEIGRASVRERV